MPIIWLLRNHCICGYHQDQRCKIEHSEENPLSKIISFSKICDTHTDLQPIIIDGYNVTDETECEQWSCNNIYTRCDGKYHCINGADEFSCGFLSLLVWSSNYFKCISYETNQPMCLSIKKVKDGNIDCLGAIDERDPQNEKIYSDNLNTFRCMNGSLEARIDSANFCDDRKDCIHGDDEQFCTAAQLVSLWTLICPESKILKNHLHINQIVNENLQIRKEPSNVFSSLKSYIISEKFLTYDGRNAIAVSPSVRDFSPDRLDCRHGIELKVWLNSKKNLMKRTCLCPMQYYGDECQYQNQRVEPIIQFKVLSDFWSTPFAIFFLLIDDDDKRIIHSYEEFTYMFSETCYDKFNPILLYSTRPKNQTKRYSVHIDIYEKISLSYRASLLIPINFPFLPVNRLAFVVNIPENNDSVIRCSNHRCMHGKCIQYFNNSDKTTFCQCYRGWSGKYCNISHTCTCSSDSLCIGVSADNRSICVCPLYRFGPRCLLTDTKCQLNGNLSCLNNGQCIPADEHRKTDFKFKCICPKGFHGLRCEMADNQIIVSFEKNISVPQIIFIHFIEIQSRGDPKTTITFKSISMKQNPIIIYSTTTFHIAIIEFLKTNYYLAVFKKNHIEPEIINKTINSSDRCRHISEILNETIFQLPPLRRIKYYQLSCQQYSHYLSCFYDDHYFCLCYNHGQQRLTNCVKFYHNATHNCDNNNNYCENEASCFGDKLICTSRQACLCRSCFYGLRCQFSTSVFGLSLDAILGYHIEPNISIIHQSAIIQISAIITMIFVIIGLINGILSLITFKNKTIREVGCDLYLLGSSITTLMTIIMFGLKYWILFLAQMKTIQNRSFLYFQCQSIDFILRICLQMDQWLNSCVAVERPITTIQGASFNKKKSKQIAKFVIIILLILNIVTNIHDPIFRRLIDEKNEDDEEKRIWCVVTYSSRLQIYNSIMHTLNIFIPFILNLISFIILITKKSRHRSNIHKNRSYIGILRVQFHQHKNLLIAPIVLVILSIPRIIIAFTSKCMESTNNSWLFLIGYFISFIPPTLTFIIFVIPSKFYKAKFHQTIVQYRTNIQRRLHLIS